MTNKNPEALRLAFKKARAKARKIKELLVEAGMEEESIEALVLSMAKAKAESTDTMLEDHIKGQDWYIRDLVAFAGMTDQERLDHEYAEAFGDLATEAEMLEALSEER